MGEVWEARHLMLARSAAVKLILADRLQAPSEAREAAIRRFTREAQITASLRSPYTVQLFDFGATDDGTLYYAMELLHGMNFEHFVYRYGPVEPNRGVHWLRQICHSLGEAHANGLTHRDLKPANLFVCTYGRERDFVKVLDFGLARPAARDGDAQLTREGSWVGTPGWISPEQIFGSEVGPASDLYALGCVAYWLLAGVRPFEAEERAELLRQHAQVAAVPLAERAPQPIPPALDAAVMACLAKDPAARPRDADELNERLAASVPGEPWSHAAAATWWQGRTYTP
jgi:serine/threonine-protein kinase